jgi:chitinase
LGINEAIQIVGWADTVGGASHAFLYSGGQMLDLGTLGGSESDSYAYDINNRGQIIASSGFGPYGIAHAFLLTPTQPLFGSWRLRDILVC